MAKRRYRRRSKVRWDRILIAALVLALALFLFIWGISALFSGGGEDESESTVSEPVSSSQPVPVEPAVDLDQWNLVLVNKENPLPADFTVTTGQLVNSLLVDARILEDLNTMMADAKAQGVELIVCSAYRDIAYQTNLYQNKVKELVSDGLTQQEAEAKAATIVSYPGTSEHNSGLAVDLVTPDYQMLNEGYADTDAAKWLAAHAPEYGFILRYPKGFEGITGIIFEPWHYRYVGREYAREITDSGMCFEQWVEAMTQGGTAAADSAADSASSDADSSAD